MARDCDAKVKTGVFREVHRLLKFLSSWKRGEEEEKAFDAEVAGYFDQDFKFVTVHGEDCGRELCLDNTRRAFGINPDGRLGVRELKEIVSAAGSVTVEYETWE